jgi:2-polyprenyl-6-methoxyphenol hydroxylase-like FAD-dependent oxidoreductase
MKTIIVGAGPTGLTLGASLAKRGHRVTAIDRDSGPARNGTWRRRGVMQFEHPHGFRPQVRDLLLTEWPEAWRTWLGLGAEPVDMPLPGAGNPVAGVRSRRATYEHSLRRAASDVDRLSVTTGTVTGVVERGGRVIGAIVDGRTVDADLVIDAGGRLSRLTASGHAELAGDTGMAYVTRNYRRNRGAGLGPMTSPVSWTGLFDGYQVYVFPHERRHFSVVVVRPTADADMPLLRRVEAFDAACAAIPGLADWIDPALAVPTSRVLVGGRLQNVFRPQRGRPGLVAVGDSLATTAPTAGRGVAMASMQIDAILRLLDAGADPVSIAEPFGAWCDMWMRPWVDDHIAIDGEAVRLWQGHDVDLAVPLTSAAIVAAAQADAGIAMHIGGYLGMTALPASLRPAEYLARAVYDSGWRQPYSAGPTRNELVEMLEAATASASTASERLLSAAAAR